LSQVTIDMSGKVALVTGGGYGMGRGSALRFAECGAHVVVADRRVPFGEETVAMIRAAGGDATFVDADVSVPESVDALFAAIEEEHGGLDYAHNNAGIIGPQVHTPDYPLDWWFKILGTNLTGTFLCMQKELPLMLARGGGAIVNVASETSYKGSVGDLAYTATKHGVVGLTSVAALEYAKKGIRINAIAPGNVRTGITEAAVDFLTPEGLHHMNTVQPVGRLSEPSEIAELVVWLCSYAAFVVNGALVAADTGWHRK
jgi:NAD(P)-dependent dehydrogenase (short-subunit alcohol dehydrogenase family)